MITNQREVDAQLIVYYYYYFGTPLFSCSYFHTQFDKTYSYNIRHNYGKEGKRADYTPYSCMKIISRVEPKGDECHGCPYKHSDSASLKALVEKRKVSTEVVEEVWLHYYVKSTAFHNKPVFSCDIVMF